MVVVRVRGLGPDGTTLCTVGGANPAQCTLDDLRAAIGRAASPAMPASQMLLFANGAALGAADGPRSLHACGVRDRSDVHLVRNVRARDYPSLRLRLSVLGARASRWGAGALASLSAAAWVWRSFAGAGAMRASLAFPLSLLASWPVPWFLCLSACCTAAFHLGHWYVNAPVLCFVFCPFPAVFLVCVAVQARAVHTLTLSCSPDSCGVFSTPPQTPPPTGSRAFPSSRRRS